eukprot:4862111-Lingulodinium_polyedra.AAC.1
MTSSPTWAATSACACSSATGSLHTPLTGPRLPARGPGATLTKAGTPAPFQPGTQRVLAASTTKQE